MDWISTNYLFIQLQVLTKIKCQWIKFVVTNFWFFRKNKADVHFQIPNKWMKIIENKENYVMNEGGKKEIIR